MRDLPGVAAHADTYVEGDGAEPDRAPLGPLLEHVPEADMMALVGTAADRLLEGKVLAAALVEEIGDGRIGIGAVEQDALGDARARLQCDGVGRLPARTLERGHDLVLVADKRDIEGIARDALRGVGGHRPAGEARLVLVVGPERGQDDVGQQRIGRRAARDQQSGVDGPAHGSPLLA